MFFRVIMPMLSMEKFKREKKETEKEARIIMENTNLKTSLFKISGNEVVWLIVWKLLSCERYNTNMSDNLM